MTIYTGDYTALAQVDGFLPEIEAGDEADFELAAIEWVRDHHEFVSDVQIMNIKEIAA